MARAASAKTAASPASTTKADAPDAPAKAARKKAAAAPTGQTAQAAPPEKAAKTPQARKTAKPSEPPGAEVAAKSRSRKPAAAVDAASAVERQPAETGAGTGPFSDTASDAASDAVKDAGMQTRDADDAVRSGPGREQRVREAAYRRYLARGRAHGHHEHDWLEAEREVDGSPEDGNKGK